MNIKILFDMRSYQISKNRGIGRYILGLYKSMVEIGGFESYILISNRYSMDIPEVIHKSAKEIYLLENIEEYKIDFKFDFYFRGNYFDGHTFDIIPKYFLGKYNKLIGISHDLIPLVYAGNYFSNNNDKYFYSLGVEYLKFTDYIFANSNATKEDMVKYINFNPNNISVIYGGVDEDRFKTANSKQPYSYKNRKHDIVCVPADDLRKNYTRLVQGFCKAYETKAIPEDSRLYLICSASNRFKNNVKNSISGKAKYGINVIVTGFVEDKKMIKILESATASIFPSIYEGLGLPILESYAAGVPCFTSNASSTREFVDTDSVFDPYNVDEISDFIVKAFSNEEFCKRNLEYGQKLLTTINWHNAAKIVLNKLNEMVDIDNRPQKTAMFSPLSTKITGISSYILNMIKNHKIDIISDIKDFRVLNDYIKQDCNNIIPYSKYNLAKQKINYCKKLFVLGNSKEYKAILDEAIKTENEENRIFYLHEASLLFLFFDMCDFDLGKIKNFANTWYPLINIKDLHDPDSIVVQLHKNNCYGIKPFLKMTKAQAFVVNDESTKTIIEQELNKFKLKKPEIRVIKTIDELFKQS